MKRTGDRLAKQRPKRRPERRPERRRLGDLTAAIMGKVRYYDVAGDTFALEFDDKGIETGKPWALYTVESDGTPCTPWETFATADDARAAVEALREFWRNEGAA